MALNPDPSQLSTQQIFQRAFEASDDSIRIILGSSTDMAISLDRTDEVTNYPGSVSVKVDLDNSLSGVISSEIDAKGIKNVNLHVITVTDITSPQVLTLQYSPHDTDDVWINTSVTVTPSLTAGTIVSGTAISSLLARRVRISAAGAIASGTASVYLIGMA